MNTALRAATMKTSLSHLPKGLIAAVLLASLSACGGSGPSGASSSTPSGTSSGTGGSTDKVELGSVAGSAFTNAVLAISPASIPSSGSATITANLFDLTTGAAYTQAATITFSSTCGNATPTHLATLTPASTSTSSGSATSTYQSTGCTTSDLITAQATINGTTVTAQATVTIQQAQVNNIQFVSATPSNISLQGVGGITTSTVVFQVTDVNGQPVQNQLVDFSLSTTVGGITLNPASGTTDSKGDVSTNVNAGTVHTSVDVIATVHGTAFSNPTPNAITISTGLPTESRFSMAIASHNVAAYNHDDIQDLISVRLSDRDGNPVIDGTKVQFIDNAGGQLAASCTTSGGGCQVTWISSGNRPQTDSLNKIGHSHILAYAVGEEDFIDNNDDSIFDNNDSFSLFGAAGTCDTFFGGPCQNDIGDPYMDSLETGTYTTGEQYRDIAAGVARRAPDQKWYGAGCGGFGTTTANVSVVSPSNTIQCANILTMVGRDDCIVMSTDFAKAAGANPVVIDGAPTVAPWTVAGASSHNIAVTFSDLNGNTMASGTVVSIVSANLNNDTVTLAQAGTGTSFTIPDVGCKASGPVTFNILVHPNSTVTPPSTGQIYLQVASPNGANTLFGPFNVN